MFGIPKIFLFIGIVLISLMYWATSNVCRYNFALEKKTNILNVVTEEIDPTLGNAEYYYYSEINCNEVYLDWDIDRVINNLETLTVLMYQELTTDIKGNPN